MLGKGVYSLPEAARLTGLSVSRVREWFRRSATEKGLGAVFRSDYAPVDGDRAISFLDMVELFVVGQLRENGLSLQRLRRVHKQLQEDWGVTHPFCRQELRLSKDGKRVFTCGLDERGKAEVIEVLAKQRVFAEIILPFLKRIRYDELTKLAAQWAIADMVVIDPAVCFGKPIVEPVGISTAILSKAYQANNRDAARVADWYGVEPRHVMAAVKFEARLAA